MPIISPAEFAEHAAASKTRANTPDPAFEAILSELAGKPVDAKYVRGSSAHVKGTYSFRPASKGGPFDPPLRFPDTRNYGVVVVSTWDGEPTDIAQSNFDTVESNQVLETLIGAVSKKYNPLL